MKVRLRLDGNCLRRWHLDLLEEMTQKLKITVVVDCRPTPPVPHAAIDLLFNLEAVIHGVQRSGPASRISAQLFQKYQDASPDPVDRTIDLCGDLDKQSGDVWTLTFDGVPGEHRLIELVLHERNPLVELRQRAAGVVAAGRVGSDHKGIALAAFEDALVRTRALIVAALGEGSAASRGVPESDVVLREKSSESLEVAVFAARQLARTITRKLYHLCCNAPHWRIGWRKLAGPDLFELRQHPSGGWKTLGDDGSRFFADPFPIFYRGRLLLFVEDYCHRRGKACISSVEFSSSGPVGQPEPVLEEPYHLSYPFVFEAEGRLWMIPESVGANRVDLYRLEEGSDKWILHATLISGVQASDATVIKDGARWWLFATVRQGGGSFSDSLYLWSASDFRGPWLPHRSNPVLLDIQSARPAGRMINRNGQWFRPVQDCGRTYGGALAIARVTRLDDECFAQEIEAVISPGPLWRGGRLHTLNSAGGYEFIDGSSYSFKGPLGSLLNSMARRRFIT